MCVFQRACDEDIHDIPTRTVRQRAQVNVEFEVDEHGVVNNPRIVDMNLKDYYANLSLAMVKNFRYDPLFVDGSVSVPNVQHSFRYSESAKSNGSYKVHMDDENRVLASKWTINENYLPNPYITYVNPIP